MPTTVDLIPVDRIIARLGGAEAAAQLTGVGTEAVRKWRQAGAIPSRHWPAVIAATGLTLADLSNDPALRARPTMPETEAVPQAVPQSLAPLGAGRPIASHGVAPHDMIPPGATAALVLADGAVFWGTGFGAHTSTPAPVGEVCFNTGMTGYQETLTDPSYAGQLITFTFPHIGNVGANAEDIEATSIAARGLVVKQDITEPANWRATQHLDAWLPPGRGWKGWTSRRRSPAGRRMNGTRRVGRGPTATAGRPRRSITSSRWITGRSATSCAAWPRPGAG